MRKLVDAGIVEATQDAQRVIYSLNGDTLLEARRTPIDEVPAVPATSGDPTTDRTLRHFFDGDRLKSIPAERKQRVTILKKPMEWFDPDRAYAKREINELLGMAHEDYATLRRELVNYGYMTRERATR